MPNVPITSQRSVLTESGRGSYQDSRADVTAFGADSARAIAHAGSQMRASSEEVFRAGQLLERDDDDREHTKMGIELDEFRNKAAFGDPNDPSKPGFYSTSGENTIIAYRDYDQALKDKIEELIQKAPNERVRARFQISAAERYNQYKNSALEKVGTERVKASVAVNSAQISQAQRNAALDYNDPQTIERSMAATMVAARDLSRTLGEPAEVAREREIKSMSTVIEAATLSAVKNEDAEIAEQLFKTYGNELDTDTHIRLASAVKGSSGLRKAQAEADRINAGGGSLLARLEKAKGISDPNVRKMTEEMVRTRSNDEQRAINQSINVGVMSASRAIEGGETLEAWQIKNPDTAALISTDPQSMSALRAHQRNRQQGRDFPEISDTPTLVRTETMTRDELAAISEEDMLKYKPLLSKNDFSAFNKARGAAIQALDNNTKSYAVHRRADQLLTDLAPAELQWGSKEISAALKATQSRLRLQIDKWIDEELTAGRTPTNEQLTAKINAALIPVRKAGTWKYFTTDAGFAFELEGMDADEKKNYKVPLDKVVPEVKQELIHKLRSIGIDTPTDDFLEQIFGAQAVGDKERQIRLIEDARKKSR